VRACVRACACLRECERQKNRGIKSESKGSINTHGNGNASIGSKPTSSQETRLAACRFALPLFSHLSHSLSPSRPRYLLLSRYTTLAPIPSRRRVDLLDQLTLFTWKPCCLRLGTSRQIHRVCTKLSLNCNSATLTPR
jgi:hypothetical protein